VPDRGFASIGYGLPGAMGAQLAAPEATVVGLTGDGGFNMVLGELETARRMGLGLTVIVVNNAASGYVKALQHLMYGEGNYQSSDLAETDYAAVANAMGCHGVRVERPEELEAALTAAFAERDRPIRHRRDGHARSGPDAARRRQPHGAGQEGGPRGMRPALPTCRARRCGSSGSAPR
jgi:acetolactate synthase-1/2/3 large subunit